MSTALEKVELPEGLESIGGEAFEFCPALRYLHIPPSVTSIGEVCIYYDMEEIARGIVFDQQQTEAFLSLEQADIYGGNLTLNVEETFDGTTFNLANTQSTTAQCAVFDVKLLLGGVETQPNGKITVRIPLPQGYNPERTFVYHVNTETGVLEKMNARYENGFMVFETDHFSYYAVVEEENPTAIAKIQVADPQAVDYRSKVIIKATATNVPEGYYLVMTVDGKEIKGSNTEVTYEISELTKDVTYSVKVVNANGNVQKDSSGKDLSKDGGKITCNAGFFKKIIAFFKWLFKALPTVTVKP